MWPFTSTKAEPNGPALEPVASSPAVGNPSDDSSSPSTPSSGGLRRASVPEGAIGWPNERLGIPLLFRAPTVVLTSFGFGFILGSTHGANKGAYRYRAENAHRLPTTQTGWFLYQKSKNYHAIVGGVKEGAKLGFVCMGWATLFMATEEMVDLSRTRFLSRGGEDKKTGQRDAGSTVVAGMTVAGIYSWKRGLDHFATVHTAKTAMKFSLLYGLAQDVASTIRGNPPTYVAWIKKQIFGTRDRAEIG
ncbi:hypothetical protein H2204_001200 [Knufia peltigerae]|uniref:Uncharacterized protein n=1 Tax=Knufia peltigerae TaxID=1002370 RepID=A0AA39D2Z5_9EURO|nr:hypothetical protein H2204_001200 [Knufia peltigerae]